MLCLGVFSNSSARSSIDATRLYAGSVAFNAFRFSAITRSTSASPVRREASTSATTNATIPLRRPTTSAAENSGDNEFSDDFFSEDKSDGYVLKPMTNTLLWILVGVGAGVLCAAAAACAVIFIRKAKGRKKESEKVD